MDGDDSDTATQPEVSHEYAGADSRTIRQSGLIVGKEVSSDDTKRGEHQQRLGDFWLLLAMDADGQ